MELVYRIILILGERFFLLVKEVLSTAVAVRRAVEEYYEDKALGVSTFEDILRKKPASVYGKTIGYQTTSYSSLHKILNYLKLNADDVFIDLGCGKGRVIFLTAKERLKKVIGIELNPEHARAAKANLVNFIKRSLGNTAIEIVQGDVADFDLKEGTVFYMYNPFDLAIMIKILDKIKQSLVVNPRKIRIVYTNPIYSDFLNTVDWLEPEGYIKYSYVLIWHSK